jgi:hypothetical protein
MLPNTIRRLTRYHPLSETPPAASRIAGLLGQQVKNCCTAADNLLLKIGLREAPAKKYARRVARSQEFYEGVAKILNPYGAAALQTVCDDEHLGCMVKPAAIKQPRRKAGETRPVTWAGLKWVGNTFEVFMRVDMATVPQDDPIPRGGPLEQSQKTTLLKDLKDYQIVQALASQGFA